MALTTILTESLAGDLARRATAVAQECQSIRQQMPGAPTPDDLRPALTSALLKLADGAKELRQLTARLVKDRLETEAARITAEASKQDAIIANG